MSVFFIAQPDPGIELLPKPRIRYLTHVKLKSKSLMILPLKYRAPFRKINFSDYSYLSLWKILSL